MCGLCRRCDFRFDGFLWSDGEGHARVPNAFGPERPFVLGSFIARDSCTPTVVTPPHILFVQVVRSEHCLIARDLCLAALGAEISFRSTHASQFLHSIEAPHPRHDLRNIFLATWGLLVGVSPAGGETWLALSRCSWAWTSSCGVIPSESEAVVEVVLPLCGECRVTAGF